MKTFISSLIGIVVMVILSVVVIAFIGWSRVPDMVANSLSKKMGVPVHINAIDLGWGIVKVKKLEIGNLPRSILSKAFSCGEIDVYAPFTNYFDKSILINEIDLNNVYLGLEFDSAKGPTGNWTRIMAQLESAIQADNQGKKSDRTIFIRKLVLTNINTDVVYRKEGGKVKKLPTIDRIELTNISSEGKGLTDQLMNSVLGEMLKSVFIKQNMQNMLQDLLNNQGNIQKYVEPFRGLFNFHDELDEKRLLAP